MSRAAAWEAEIEHYLDWLAASGSPPSTRRLRGWQVRHLAERHPDRSPWDLTTDDLVRWLSGHQWRPETLKSARGSLRSFYGWAFVTGRTAAQPAACLPTVRVPMGLPRPAGDLAVARALDQANDKTRLMIMLGTLAGLRAAEIAGLAWPDIDGGQLTVHGKGGKIRIIPLHPDLDVALTAERGRREAGQSGTGFRYQPGSDRWVFPSQNAGQPMLPGAVSRILGRVLGDASGHQLRHRFASRVYDHTRDLIAVQKLLGHAQISTTAIYTALPDGALRAAVLAA